MSLVLRTIFFASICLLWYQGNLVEAQTARKPRPASPAGKPAPAVIQRFRAAVKANPRDPQLRNALGLVLAQSGQIAPAIDEFREAVRLKPDFTEAWSNLA
ncbi:MAG: tetratricopeptide repeat protein, partial [Akkermansiaceae bacterium]|nr:tetratricopeptide repeat protein [Verrucomicrobiales bacterium]